MADLEAIIGGAVEDAGDVGDSGDTGGGGSDAAEAPVEAAEVPGDVAAPVDADPFATEHGITTKRQDGRENRIPYSRVKAIAENQVKKAQAEWNAQVEAERQTSTGYKTRIDEINTIEQIMASDPDRFIQMLSNVNPGYQRFAALLQQKVEEAKQAGPQDDPPPPMDYDLGNGTRTYSAEGMEKRMAWERRQAEKAIEARMDARYRPIEESYKQHQESQRVQQIQQRAAEGVKTQLDQAAQWPQFVEHQADILKVLQGNQQISLHEAYMSVVMPRLATDRTKMRQELLAELKKVPSATSTAASAPVAGAAPASQSLEDIIKAAAAGIKG